MIDGARLPGSGRMNSFLFVVLRGSPRHVAIKDYEQVTAPKTIFLGLETWLSSKRGPVFEFQHPHHWTHNRL